MTYQPDCTLPDDLLDHLTEGGLEALPDAIRASAQCRHAARTPTFIGAEPYQRTAERQAHANGFKAKTLQTRMGEPHRCCPTGARRRLLSSEPGERRPQRACPQAGLAEMYVQGVSTRKVAAITEQMCGFEVSSIPRSVVLRPSSMPS